MKEITGVEISTLESWCVSAPLDQVRTLLRLLSAIPTRERRTLIESATLSLPRLDHEYFAGDKVTSSLLTRIAAKSRGLTIIEGESDYLATFLGTAIANSASFSGTVVSGYDIHSPDWFVPVEGVKYLGIAENPGRLREVKDLKWELPMRSELVFFNGLWRFLEQRRRLDLLKAASFHHLVLCDRQGALEETVKMRPGHVLSVSRNPLTPLGEDDALRMRLAITAHE